MKVTSIPSVIPSWIDPTLDGFAQPKSWEGTRVRIAVPVGNDPTRDLESARKEAEKRYPGAMLVLVPEFSKNGTVDSIDPHAGDEALLRDYLTQARPPEPFCVEQAMEYLRLFLPNVGLFGVQGLRFERVAAKDVLCFESVELRLDVEGLTLISGSNKDWPGVRSNGSGKSSLACIAFLALFGRTFKNQQHDGWARQGTNATARLDLTLLLPDERRMQIIRTRRPSSLRVWIDGKEATMADQNQTQALIESLTNLTWEVLTNSVYVGQREIGSVFGTEKERKELFSRLLGLDRFLDAQEKLRKEALKRQRSVEEVERELIDARSALREADGGTAEIERMLAGIVPVDAKALSYAGVEIGNLAARIADNERDVAAMDPEIDANQKVFENILGKRLDAEARYDQLKEQLDNTSKLKSQCPTCGSTVSIKALEAFRKSLRVKIEDVDEEIDSHSRFTESNRAVRKALIEKVQEKRQQNARLRSELEALSRETAVLQAQAQERARLESVLRGKAERVRKLKRSEATHLAALAECTAMKAFTEFCLRAVGRDGLPAHLYRAVEPQLNAAAARYSEIFTEGEINVQFHDQDVVVVNRHGGANVRDQSSGEMRLAGIIAALAFRDALILHNLLVLDEPSEGLDAVNCEAFARGLSQVVDRFGHVMVISHNAALLEGLEPDRTLEVVKQGGVATVRKV